MDLSNESKKTIPIWGILSVAMTPLGALFIIVVAVILESFKDKPAGVSISAYVPTITWVSVFVTKACIAAGLVAAVTAFVKRERPRWLPLAGVVSTICIIVLFIYSTGAD